MTVNLFKSIILTTITGIFDTYGPQNMCTCVSVSVCVCVYVYLGLCLYVYACIDMYMYVCLLCACVHAYMSTSAFVEQGEQDKFTNTGNPRGCLLVFEMDSEARPEGRYQGAVAVRHTSGPHLLRPQMSRNLKNSTSQSYSGSNSQLLIGPNRRKGKVYLRFPSPHMPWSQHGPSALVHVGGPPVYLQRKPQLPCKAQN